MQSISTASLLILAVLPLAAVQTAILAVTLYDWHLYRRRARDGTPTISDGVRELYARYGVIVPILYVAAWMLTVFVPMTALFVHWFLNEY